MERSFRNWVFILTSSGKCLANGGQAAIIRAIPPEILKEYGTPETSSITKHYSGGGIFGWYALPLVTNNLITDNKSGAGLATSFASASDQATSSHISGSVSTHYITTAVLNCTKQHGTLTTRATGGKPAGALATIIGARRIIGAEAAPGTHTAQIAATVPVGKPEKLAASNHTSAGVPTQAQHRQITGEFPR